MAQLPPPFIHHTTTPHCLPILALQHPVQASFTIHVAWKKTSKQTNLSLLNILGILDSVDISETILPFQLQSVLPLGLVLDESVLEVGPQPLSTSLLSANHHPPSCPWSFVLDRLKPNTAFPAAPVRRDD